MSYSLNPSLRMNDYTWPKHWPQWVIEICTELEAIEYRFPSTLYDGTPRWVDKMSLRIVQCMNPTTDIMQEVSGPSFLGSMVGHFIWLIECEDGISALIKRYFEALEKLDTELRTNLSEGDYNKLVERIENSGAVEETERMTRSLYRVILRKGKALERCLKTVVDQSLPDQADFFEAYAQALKNPPLDQTGALVMEKSTGVSNIYLLMVLNWKFVRKFTSAAKCYLWLSKILGSQVVGNEERIQKMCARFGVKFSRHKRNKRKKKRKYRTR